MNRSEYEVTGFSGADRGFERFVVTHLADQHHVRILSHQCAQGFVEVNAVDADLALIDGRLVVLEDVLDRIFDRHDVNALAFIDVLQHRRDGGRLARTGDAREQNQSLGTHGDLAE